MNATIAYALAKKFTSKSLAGLGSLKGSPCKIKSVQPVYSTEDSTVVVKNIVTLEWDSNQNPSGSPVYHEETVEILDNGRGVYDIEINQPKCTAAETWYTITFYDGTTDEFYIPTSSGSLKKKVVSVLPLAADADKNAIYLVPVTGKPGSYQQWLAVENDATSVWEWLSLGTTDVDLSAYQTKTDEQINKVYPNYDPATKGTVPTSKNLVGAVNEFNLALGVEYDYSNGQISNLLTKDKTSIVAAVNELGDISTAEGYDAVNRNTFVKLINAANSEFSIDQGSVDRTKYIDVLDPKKDSKDGTVKTAAGLSIKIPRVDIVKRTTTEATDYATYDLKIADALSDPNDATAKQFGQIHIPKIRIAKNDPPEMESTDTITVDTWTVSGSSFISNVVLTHIPVNSETVVATLDPAISGATANITFTKGSANAVVSVTSSTTPSVCDVTFTFTCENPTLAAEYYLEVEGKDWSEPISGTKIEIAKSMVLKSGSVKKCEQDGVPLSNLIVGDLYLDLEFETGPVSQHAYIAVKDLFRPYEGKEAIEVEYDSVNEINKIKLNIYDPDANAALVQTNDGLRIMNATETQKGVVDRATQAETRSATDSTKYVSPLNLKDFVVNSDAVKNDLGNLYVDDAGNIVNNTIIKAINEVASVAPKKLDVAEDGDIATYVVQSHPSSTVWRELGEKIHIEQVIKKVDTLSTVVSPKKYELYYLATTETISDVEYQAGLYMWDETAVKWVATATTGGIVTVEALPVTHINERALYLVPDDRTITGRYVLSDDAIAAGYSMSENGIDLVFPAQHWGWSQVAADWESWIGDELVENVNGPVCLLSDGSIQWEYVVETNHLYYHYDNQWIEFPKIETITNDFINQLEMWN